MLAHRSLARIVPTLAVASLLLASAALTGCNDASSSSTGDGYPSLLGASHFNGEPISTLGANYPMPLNQHHQAHLHDLPGHTPNRQSRHAL